MFDDRRFQWTREAYRTVDPPVPVEIDVGKVLPPERLTWGRDTPIWVCAGGLAVNSAVPGLLRAWVLTAVGRWWGLCDFELRSRNGELVLPLHDQLVPASALRPATGTARSG